MNDAVLAILMARLVEKENFGQFDFYDDAAPNKPKEENWQEKLYNEEFIQRGMALSDPYL